MNSDDRGLHSKKLNYHLKTNKNFEKGNQLQSSSPIIEDKFQSKTINMKTNNIPSFNNRFEKKPVAVR